MSKNDLWDDEDFEVDEDVEQNEVDVQIPIRAFIPHYRHLLASTADINFLWGGRDSGKSHFIAQKLIYDCLTLPYFRCFLIKKTDQSIKESQWQTIKDIVEGWGFGDLFQFRISPLSIQCVNGNRFIARGCNDPQMIKSTKDPSHAWYEEGNQLTLEDFITVTTTLRAGGVKIQQWFSFNPECDGDYEDFWLYKTFFRDKPGLSFSAKWEIEQDDQKIVYNYTSTHSTYHINPHCTPQRKIFLEQLKEISPYYYSVYTLGLWGRRQNHSPFAYAFDRTKHIADNVQYRPGVETMLSFDFNRSPICAGVYQFYDNTIWNIESIKLENSDIYKLCDYIKTRYAGALFIVTGDASGRASSALVQDGINYYTVIQRQLNLSINQIRVPSVNPLLKENQVLVNAVLYTMNVKLDRQRSKSLIFDMENVRVQADGTIEKRDRTDPTQQADSIDHFRYLCNTFFRHALRK